MLVSDFDYALPPERIAQTPLPERSGSRLLHLQRETGAWRDGRFVEFPDLLRPDDLLVVNNSRVIPARLYGRRGGQRAQTVSPHNPAAQDFPQGVVEVLLTRQLSAEPNQWECLVRPGKKIGVGEHLYFGDAGELEAEVLWRGEFGERRIRFRPVPDFFQRLEKIGHVPLPPYIGRADESGDRERYQTIYAQDRGSVAAPTAGLHFTSEILSRIRQRGIEIAEVTLHVGLGTFQPVRVENIEKHKLHGEWYSIAEPAAAALNRARREGRRVVAVGTTSVRTLEFAAQAAGEGPIEARSGKANLFIVPGYGFRVVGAMLTNFHLPQSTLLMLVSAFGGRENVLRAYHHAVEAEYRFYSYGDCMFVE